VQTGIDPVQLHGRIIDVYGAMRANLGSRFIAYPLLIVGLYAGMAHAVQVALSADEHRIVPLESYTCQQKVYVHVGVDKLSPGTHHVDASWQMPNGKVQERTSYDFKAPAQNVVLWLEAEKPFQLIGTLSWSGRWAVEIFLDTHSLGLFPFQMSC
jgi:hypothetical protein